MLLLPSVGVFPQVTRRMLAVELFRYANFYDTMRLDGQQAVASAEYIRVHPEALSQHACGAPPLSRRAQSVVRGSSRGLLVFVAQRPQDEGADTLDISCCRPPTTPPTLQLDSWELGRCRGE